MNRKLFFASIIIVLIFGGGIIVYNRLKTPGNLFVPELKPADLSKSYKSVLITSFFYTNMEDPEYAIWRGLKSSEKSLSGRYSNKLSEIFEFGMTFLKNVGEIPNYNRTKQIKIYFSVYSDSPLKNAAFVYAVSGATKDTLYDYLTVGFDGNINQWTKKELVFNVNSDTWEKDCMVKIYPWNPGKETFFIDDVKIEFYSEEERQYGIPTISKLNFLYDFETADSSIDDDYITDDAAHSGKHSLRLPGLGGSTSPIVKRYGEITGNNLNFISTSFWIYPKNDNPSLEIFVALESPEGQLLAWTSKETDNMVLKKKEWHKINFRADLREKKALPEDLIKIYIRNYRFGTVLIDDFEIIYGDIPLPSGVPPGIVADLTGHIIMRAGKNKAPFRQDYFKACEENALNLPAGIKNGGTLVPGSKMIAGQFLNSGGQHDELLMAEDNSWTVFKWCASENNLVRIFNSNKGPGVLGKIVLKGNFNTSVSEEVIVIDTAHKMKAQIVHFNSAEDVCNNKLTHEPGLEITDAKFTGIDFQQGQWEIYSGNFRNNNLSEILFVNKKTGSWHLFENTKEIFDMTGSGILPEGVILSGLQFNNDGKFDKLIVFCERNHQLDHYLADFSGAKKDVSITEFNDKSFLQNFGYNSKIISGQFSSSPEKELFYFNDDWRLDLKKINIDANGINVESQMEFHNNDSLNPKYYEFIQVIPGNFFNKNESNLLVLTRNCKDREFNGGNCNDFENATGLPPGFMFYRYQPAK